MAKSLRSKWRRKMRAIKREKNEKRVLVKLKETLKNHGKINLTEDMCKFAQIELRQKEREQEKEKSKMEEQQTDEGGNMNIDTKRNPKTLLDEHGQYPSWMNTRQMKRMREERKNNKKKPDGVKKTGRNKKLLW
uniref:Protein LLP homolog n=1 Tax=Phallusia mammillata TaxID=59560 RepID=A0A6F9DJY2_9ASCI|nr:protein LLP homolog [Phallusia mammillata]